MSTLTIPRRLVRTVPAKTDKQVEKWWEQSCEVNPTWEHVTLREPLNPDMFPSTAKYWDLCQHGAQKAGLIRLDYIYSHGGVYIDSDVRVYRPLDPLCQVEMFAGWEDPRCIPDAMFGARAFHPAVATMLSAATKLVELGRDPWDSGPGVFTDVLPERSDVMLFPPGTLYPYHYSQKRTAARGVDYGKRDPWCYAVHHWAGSWVGK